MADVSIFGKSLQNFAELKIQLRVNSVTMTKVCTAEASGFEFPGAPWLKPYLCQA